MTIRLYKTRIHIFTITHAFALAIYITNNQPWKDAYIHHTSDTLTRSFTRDGGGGGTIWESERQPGLIYDINYEIVLLPLFDVGRVDIYFHIMYE